ncbi:unnamed protein product [Lupinus luteus]|uniref:Uncharacterized protein n=1 Tax=Lupinus luteus TaxID=3873 RepID=A0AAV1YMV0_LUPLU
MYPCTGANHVRVGNIHSLEDELQNVWIGLFKVFFTIPKFQRKEGDGVKTEEKGGDVLLEGKVRDRLRFGRSHNVGSSTVQVGESWKQVLMKGANADEVDSGKLRTPLSCLDFVQGILVRELKMYGMMEEAKK